MRVRDSFVKMVLVIVILLSGSLSAQPVYESKKKIFGIHIFPDSTDPLLFYYEPGELALSLSASGKPDFQFLDMRYTGSKCYNDQGEKNFMSLLQFGVEMKRTDVQALKSIRKELSINSVKLVPLPISHIKTQLIIAAVGDSKENNLDKEGALEAMGKEGYSTSRTYWSKRNFFIKLNEHESQVLSEQLKKGGLGVSLGYSYSANFKRNNDAEILGSAEIVESIRDIVENTKDVEDNKVVKSDVLVLQIDIEKYPSAIRQIDLNEEIPPAYANTEIRCYDFKSGLRPNLYIKIVEIEAQSVDREKPITIETKFLRKQPDLYAKHISFPYAIYVDTPMRYRVTEITSDGERTVSEWTTKESCSSVIDITTQF